MFGFVTAVCIRRTGRTGDDSDVFEVDRFNVNQVAGRRLGRIAMGISSTKQ